jgi:aspartyl/asparaginyl-tRNA synthetase
MTEYTSLGLEMAINSHYREGMHIVDETLKHIFHGIYSRFRLELDAVKQRFPRDDLMWHDETTVLAFVEGIKLRRESDWKDDDGRNPSEHEDLHKKTEKRLGELFKQEYPIDYYILDKFPTSARLF